MYWRPEEYSKDRMLTGVQPVTVHVSSFVLSEDMVQILPACWDTFRDNHSCLEMIKGYPEKLVHLLDIKVNFSGCFHLLGTKFTPTPR